MQICVGDYWLGFDEHWQSTDDTFAPKGGEFLILIAATSTVNRKRYFLGINCDWNTKAPSVDLNEDFIVNAQWFDRDGKSQNCGPDLVKRVPGKGTRHLMKQDRQVAKATRRSP